jgi:hypothetical protein
MDRTDPSMRELTKIPLPPEKVEIGFLRWEQLRCRPPEEEGPRFQQISKRGFSPPRLREAFGGARREDDAKKANYLVICYY